MVNSITILIIIVLLMIIFVMAMKWPKAIKLEDDAPASGLKKDGWLKLQNEGMKYVEYKDGKVILKIFKK